MTTKNPPYENAKTGFSADIFNVAAGIVFPDALVPEPGRKQFVSLRYLRRAGSPF